MPRSAQLASRLRGSALERTRLVFATFALLIVVLAVPLALVVGDAEPWVRALAVAGLGWTALRHVDLCRTRRPRVALTPIDVAALVVVTVGVGTHETLGVLFMGVFFRSLYGGPRDAALNAGVYLVAYVAPALAGTAGAVSVGEALSQVPGLLISAAVMQLVAATLHRDERRRTRERLLRESGARLVAARDREEIHRVGVESTLATVAQLPGTRVVLWRGDGDELEAVAAVGDGAGDVAGRTLRLGVLSREHVDALRAGEIIRVDAREQMDDRPPLPFPLKRGGVLIVPLHTQRQRLGALVTSSDSPLPHEAEDTMRALASQVALALEAEQLTARRSEARFGSLIRNASDVITVVDGAHVVRYQTPSITRVLGHDPAAVLGRPLGDLLHPDDRAPAAAFLARVTLPDAGTATAEWRMAHRDGGWREVEVVAADLTADANVCGVVLTSRDVTERKALERRLAHQAFHDPLTGLANRELFRDRVEHARSRARRAGSAAVLFIDVDDFKNVNDTLGHAAGDHMLALVADRLRACVRPGDTAARLGGDEFGVLLEDIGDARAAERSAARLLAALEQPLAVGGRDVAVRASVGIALIGGEVTGADDLLRNADIAMYAAKADGKSRVRVFEPAMYADTLERVELVEALEGAEARGELRLHYQPVVELAGGAPVGGEALIRWEHPERGLLAPSEFVPLAEQNGVIRRIGRWVITEACRQLRAWRDADPAAAGLRVGINLAPGQLGDVQLARHVADGLAAYDLEPESLILEITESAVIDDLDAGLARLHELASLGVLLALDDFGTGYSSLSYLQRFPLAVLKLDRSFTEQLRHDEQEARVAGAIVALGQSMGLKIVAEGVEDAGQAAAVRRLGCEMAQGFHFARPVPPDRFLGAVAALAGVAALADAA